MAAEEAFRDRFNPQGEVEARWLERFFEFVTEHVWPLQVDSDLTYPPGEELFDEEDVMQLSTNILKRIKDANWDSQILHETFTPMSISELVSHQRACASYPWLTFNPERAATPEWGTLPQERILLIGHLTDGGNGDWMLRDAKGGVVCEVGFLLLWE
ncbi:CST complex subunit CTC1-like [Stigmatopora nigra]